MSSAEQNEEMPTPKRRRRVDFYDVRSSMRAFVQAGLMGIAGYTLLMAGLWLQAHR